MDVKSLRDREFNKRVRDVVSRDQNRLRERFDKYDKECAERMAEIHHMQEKVRFSMRSLAMDKIHISQATSGAKHHRRSSESRMQSDVKEDNSQVSNKRDDDGQEGKQTRDTNELSKRHRASITSMSSKPPTLDIPGAITAKRRVSSPFALRASASQSPKQPRQETSSNAYVTGNRPAMSSSYPLTDGYMVHTLNRTSKSQPRPTDTHNMLSVNDMRMTAKSPVINLRRKSADEVRGNRKASERKGERECSPNRLQTETRSVRPRSTSVSHLPNPQVSSPRNQRKLSATGQKVQLSRTRSNSLPDLLSPDSIQTTTKQVGSSEDIANKKSKNVQTSKPFQISSCLARSQANHDNSPLARSFEEMRHCRYLRCSDTDI